MSGTAGEASEPTPARDPTYAGALACFFLSGFAALLYQTVWAREFALVFGTADLAVATVLAAYMAGLALGAHLASRVVGRVGRPLLLYAGLELTIAIAAVLVPVAIRASTALAVRLLGSGDALPSATGPSVALFYLACGFAIVLVPTACMGATLPLLARRLVRTDVEITGRIGALYATNTAGAVVGAVVAGFLLVPSVGLGRTVLVGVAANVTACVLAATVARAQADRASDETADRAGALDRGSIVVLVAMLLSGMTSFTYEVVWTRLLGHVLGASTYAFATMLATFLTGIALGSALAARLAATRKRAVRGLALAELAIAAAALAAFHAMDLLPTLAVQVGAGRDPMRLGNVALAAVVMLPATLALGATFPLAVRALAADRDDAAPASARVYAWNTAGAVVGALGAGFWLMPVLGYAGVVAAAVAVNLGVAALIALATPPRSALLATIAVVAAGTLVTWPPSTPWTLVGASPLSVGRSMQPPEFFAVGRSAGVGVALEGGVYKLRTNGLPEGVMLPPRRYRRAIPDRWLGALPFLARPDARRALVVGLGAGTALETLPPSIGDVDVIELEPRVIEANERFRERRAVDPLALPGLRLHVNDARGALALTTGRWDVVISQPSHPWTAGAAHLYTREFFRAVRDHLGPDGVFVQWIDLDLVDRPLFATLVATMLDVYPYVRVYRPFFRSTAIFIASPAPLAVEASADTAIAAAPTEMLRAGVQTREDVAAAFALDEQGARSLADAAPLTTDDRNLLESRAIRVSAPLGYRGADDLLAPFDPLPAELPGLDRLYLVRRLLADWDFARVARVVAALGDPVERATAAGIVALATERTADGEASLRAALAQDPGAYEARVALVRAERARLVRGAPDIGAIAAALGDPARAVVAGWSREAAGDLQAVRALEPRLVAARPNDAVYGDALRLRAAWRIASGDPSAALEALALLVRFLPMSVDPEDYVQRARAAAAAGDVGVAIESLTQALDSTTPGAFHAVADRVATDLAALPTSAAVAEDRALLERKIAAFRR